MFMFTVRQQWRENYAADLAAAAASGQAPRAVAFDATAYAKDGRSVSMDAQRVTHVTLTCWRCSNQRLYP